MQASMPAKVDTLTPGQASPAIDYARAVDELLQLYTRIDMAAVAMPIVDVPLLRFLVKQTPAPSTPAPSMPAPSTMNVVSGNGDLVGFIGLRPLIAGMLHGHFCRRLRAVRQHILLETAFSEDAAKATLARIDRAMDLWRRITFQFIFFTWFLPLMGSVPALVRWLFPDALIVSRPWVVLGYLGFSLAYIFLVLASAFAVKRGLMLGGTGHDAYYPFLLSGAGGYAQEREILGALGLACSEFPLDLIFSIPLLLFFMAPLQWTWFWLAVWIMSLFLGLLITISLPFFWIRRKKLGRC